MRATLIFKENKNEVVKKEILLKYKFSGLYHNMCRIFRFFSFLLIFLMKNKIMLSLIQLAWFLYKTYIFQMTNGVCFPIPRSPEFFHYCVFLRANIAEELYSPQHIWRDKQEPYLFPLHSILFVCWFDACLFLNEAVSSLEYRKDIRNLCPLKWCTLHISQLLCLNYDSG